MKEEFYLMKYAAIMIKAEISEYTGSMNIYMVGPVI
jgi:hypothetical protein